MARQFCAICRNYVHHEPQDCSRNPGRAILDLKEGQTVTAFEREQKAEYAAEMQMQRVSGPRWCAELQAEIRAEKVDILPRDPNRSYEYVQCTARVRIAGEVVDYYYERCSERRWLRLPYDGGLDGFLQWRSNTTRRPGDCDVGIASFCWSNALWPGHQSNSAPLLSPGLASSHCADSPVPGQVSHLLRLPRELRDQIYLEAAPGTNTFGIERADVSAIATASGLPLVSTQLRQELWHLYHEQIRIPTITFVEDPCASVKHPVTNGKLIIELDGCMPVKEMLAKLRTFRLQNPTIGGSRIVVVCNRRNGRRASSFFGEQVLVIFGKHVMSIIKQELWTKEAGTGFAVYYRSRAPHCLRHLLRSDDVLGYYTLLQDFDRPFPASQSALKQLHWYHAVNFELSQTMEKVLHKLVPERSLGYLIHDKDPVGFNKELDQSLDEQARITQARGIQFAKAVAQIPREQAQASSATESEDEESDGGVRL